MRLGPWVSEATRALQAPQVNKASLASLEKKGPRGILALLASQGRMVLLD